MKPLMMEVGRLLEESQAPMVQPVNGDVHSGSQQKMPYPSSALRALV